MIFPRLRNPQVVRVRGVESEKLCQTVRDIDLPEPFVAVVCLKYGSFNGEPRVLSHDLAYRESTTK